MFASRFIIVGKVLMVLSKITLIILLGGMLKNFLFEDVTILLVCKRKSNETIVNRVTSKVIINFNILFVKVYIQFILK